MASGSTQSPRGRPRGGATNSPATGESPPKAKSARPRSKYAARACDECRRRRAKCDGNKPCARCATRNLVCKTADDEDARGTAPKSYVRMLQARIHVLERILQLHSINIDAAIARLEQDKTAPANTTSLAADGSPTTLDHFCGAFEGSLTLDESLNFDRDGQARYFGPSSGRLDFQSLEDCSQEGVPQRTAAIGQIEQKSIANANILGDNNPLSGELESHLLDLYFTWEQPWFPVVDERLFRESKRTNGRYYSPLLLNSILAVASRHSDRMEVRTDRHDANTAGRMFLEEAEMLLRVDLRQPSITTLQSVAVLGTVYVAFGYDAAGWLHQGMASRLVLDMGLHLDPGALVESNCMSPEEAELRRQIYWSLYCVDKLFASYTGRLCTMLDFQGAVGLPSVQKPSTRHKNHQDPTTVDRSLLIALQNALSTLCQILESILLSLYSPKKLPEGAQRQSFFDSTLLALKSWLYTLSPEIKPIRADKVNTLPQAITLCMVYHTTVILLAKPFLVVEQHNHQSGKGPTQHEPSSSLLPEKAVALTLEAAKNISTLGDRYREGFGSFRRSPISATHCTLSAVLAILQLSNCSNHTADGSNADKIRPCLRTLHELSVSWTPPRRYYQNLLKMVRRATTTHNETKELDLAVIEGRPSSGLTIVGPEEDPPNLSFSQDYRNDVADEPGWAGHLLAAEPPMYDQITMFDTPYWPGFETDDILNHEHWEKVLLESTAFDLPNS
ncbi:fungal-specific transcription factor domain-containing protein [Truncatella angustata]|uniref:Fungal-specific transcription factor domain-containing protein n=1 Tax=Truncatella angustata TaxID=152316 RepID=A0A9P8RJJ6_9PEZI|nr:fungal-specific transcription factor domain-containing protein [Truncatella angustata]KAH6647228.1 fungal-specific transcription factor domain-containing protein [Truncatella angustata]